MRSIQETIDVALGKRIAQQCVRMVVFISVAVVCHSFKVGTNVVPSQTTDHVISARQVNVSQEPTPLVAYWHFTIFTKLKSIFSMLPLCPTSTGFILLRTRCE